jgi:amino acid adenylation domain-containing protein
MNQNTRLITEYQNAGNYWSNLLSGELADVRFPGDFPGAIGQKKGNYDFCVKEKLYSRLSDMSRNKDSGFYVLLLAAFKILLYKYSGKSDIIVGSPLYGDTGVIDNEDKCIPLRTVLNDEMTFKELLLLLKNSSRDAYLNQYYPLKKIYRLLGIKNNQNLFRNIVLSENIHHKETVNDIINSPANDITISFFRDQNKLTGAIEYNAKYFKEKTIKRLARHYDAVLKKVLLEPEIKLKDIDMLSAGEKRQLVIDFNEIGDAPPPSQRIHELFEQQVEKTPDNIVILFEDVRITYKKCNEGANRLAGLLTSKGAARNHIVGLMMDSSPEMVVAIMGILKSGAAYLPVDPYYPEERKKYIFENSGIGIVVTQDRFFKDTKKALGQNLPGYILVLPGQDNRFDDMDGVENFENRGGPDDPAYLIFTSGTTGKPKGTLVRHGGLVNYTFWRIRNYKYTAADITLQLLSYSFDGFASNFYSALCSGGILVSIRALKMLDVGYIGGSIKKYRVTNTSLVPGLYGVLLDGADKGSLNSLRFVVLAGEKSSADLIKKSKEKIPALLLINEYGPTEATVTAAAHIGMDESGCNIIGAPISNAAIYIFDGLSGCVPVNVPGEMVIGGAGIAVGYLNDVEQTAERFIKNPYNREKKLFKTGDRGMWLADGNIEFSGRIDRQVKIKGYRVEIGEIESRLLKIAGVRQAVVMDNEEKNGDTYLCAYVEIPEAPGIAVQEIKRELLKFLPYYMIPSFFVPLTEFPRTPNGKIDKNALPEPEIGKAKDFIAPRTSIETKMVELWSEVLNIDKEKISINENFFDLGGNSLKIVQLNSMLIDMFNVDIPTVELFRNSTIASFLDYISRDKNKPVSNGVKEEKLEEVRESLHDALTIFGEQ